MSLRELVTGSDVCSPGDGAGPSNALAGLANSLVGTSSKEQERLRELPGFHGLPGASEARFKPQSIEDAARAAAEGEHMAIPGILPGGFQGREADVEDFMRGAQGGRAPDLLPWFQEFEGIHGQGRQERDAAFGAAGPSVSGPLTPFLHAFFDSAKAQRQFQPLPSPRIDLSIEDQCRIRDRSTIMARHVFADGGGAFADEQVGRLLQSLHIDPAALPGQPGGASWDDIYARGGGRWGAGPAQDMVAGRQAANLARPVDGWANEFANLNLQDGRLNSDRMAEEFLKQQNTGPSHAWASEFAEGPGANWASEFDQAQASDSAVRAGAVSGSAAAMEQTRALADTMAASQDPKFKNSKFLQFVSKMSRGEIILEDNQAKEQPSAAVGNAWADEHTAEAQQDHFEDAWDQVGNGGPHTWADHFQQEQHPPNAWADQFGAENPVESWAAEFSESVGAQLGAQLGDQEYVFSPNNPFLSDMESFGKGKELFRNGVLTEAVLALEAEVQRQPRNVEAWRLLGTVHAENDDDQQAIAAMRKALAADPSNSEVLLSLGVSHVNELDQSRALGYLLAWLSTQPGHAGAASVELPQGHREKLRAVVDIFRRAAEQNAGSADAHVALGVLYNLSRDYDGAVGAFRTALQTRTTDYSLWNKLGATLANSGRSGEAISAYQRALDLKPNYMRAWTNMGISQANIGEYDTSARFYVRALALNPAAANVWGYLRTSLSCAGRNDLMQAVEDEDLEALSEALSL